MSLKNICDRHTRVAGTDSQEEDAESVRYWLEDRTCRQMSLAKVNNSAAPERRLLLSFVPTFNMCHVLRAHVGDSLVPYSSTVVLDRTSSSPGHRTAEFGVLELR